MNIKLPNQYIQRAADGLATLVGGGGAAAGLMGGIGAAMPIVGAGLGIIETVAGFISKAKAQKKINGLLDQRKAFQTSQEVYDIVNASLNQAGGDTLTRDFESNQINQGLSNSISAATRLGADPNTLANLFQQQVQGQMQVGQNFHKSNMEAFSGLLSSYKLLADNKDAEYASQQSIVKDKLAAAGANLASSQQGIQGGVNTVLSSLASQGEMDLYKTEAAKNNQKLMDMIAGLKGVKENPTTTSITSNSTAQSSYNIPDLTTASGLDYITNLFSTNR